MPEHMPGWEQRLLATAAEQAEVPDTPDIVSTVRDRIAAEPPGQTALRPRVVRVVAAAVVVMVVLALTVAASRDVRDAVADFLGLGVQGEVIERLPTPQRGEAPTPLPTPQNLQAFATPVSAGEASRALGFSPEEPAGAGDPVQVYLVGYSGVQVAVLHYATFDLWEENTGIFEKSIGFVGKGLPEQTVLEQLTVNGRPAYWIRGGAHLVRFVGADGTVVAGSQRTVLTDTLVWRGAQINYRLEGDLDRDAALKMAESLP